jgi:hypothetical protein
LGRCENLLLISNELNGNQNQTQYLKKLDGGTWLGKITAWNRRDASAVMFCNDLDRLAQNMTLILTQVERPITMLAP